jgi:hypothetical protein
VIRPTVLAVVLCLAGCEPMRYFLAGDVAMKLPFDREAVNSEVLKQVPLESPVEKVRHVMEANGFKPSAEHIDDDNPNQKCIWYYYNYAHRFVFLDQIRVNVYHNAGVVTKVEVMCSTVGP